MNCLQVTDRLDDYVDGGLSEAEFQEVELHLHQCAECREQERLLRSVLSQAAALPREVAPPQDLWPGIASRIQGRGRVLPFLRRLAARPRWELAAAAAALIALTTAVALSLRSPGPGPQVGMAPSGSVRTVTAGASGDFAAAEAQYVEATTALLTALNERRDSFSPETWAVVEENLRVIDQALEKVREALRKDPGNSQLTHMLASTHRKKVDLLQQVLKLSSRI